MRPAPDNRHAAALLATLLHQCNFSVGCYCEEERHGPRCELRELRVEDGARMAAFA